jgi:tetratricopeptide (TPR) repeat protein
LTLLSFAAVWKNGFIESWDDGKYLVHNPHVAGGLTWDGVAWAFTTTYASNWHPLTWLSHMLDVQLFGMHAGAHHLVGLAFHAANAALLFHLLMTTTGAKWRSAFVAALFAVHPLHVESVAWASERKDVLSTLFLFLTMLAYVRWTRRRTAARYVAMLVAYAAGLMAKPMLVTAPFLLLLLDWWPLARITSRRDVVAAAREKIPLFAMAAASSVITFVAQRQGGAVLSFEQTPIDRRVANVPVAYVSYVGKTLWPAKLSAFYPSLTQTNARVWLTATVATSALAVVTWLAVRVGRARPYVAVGWLWFMGTLVPVIGLVQIGWQSMADRYSYVSIVGLFVVVAWAGAEWAASRRGRRAAAFGAASVVVAACAATTFAQVGCWRDDVRMWEQAERATDDNLYARVNLGWLLMERGDVERAVGEFDEALRISPESALAHNDKGLALIRLGRSAEALREFEDAVHFDDRYAEARSNLGIAYRGAGRVDEAVAQYAAAIRLSPTYAPAYANLADALGAIGRLDAAVAAADRAVALDPQRPGWHANLGALLEARGDRDAALAAFEAELAVDPTNTVVAREIDRMRRETGDGSRGNRRR